MDIEFNQKTPQWQQVFQPLCHFSIHPLYQQPITLQNTFSSLPQLLHEDILLTLINNTLLLSNPQQLQIEPFAAVQLTFDLKFAVIYEVEKNVNSNKIGIKISYNQTRSFTIYSSHVDAVEAWVYVLQKKINRQGFHQMFKPLRKLGKGNFASVYEVERLTDGRRFAVKAFSKQVCFNTENGKESLVNELHVMRQLTQQCDPNVLRLESVFESDNSIYVIFELLSGGQLLNLIKKKSCVFSEDELKQFMRGLLSGMRTMHRKRIMHRDLKPENIMIRSSDSMSPVIVDFGLATHADQDKYLFFRCGTPGYVAPEIIELNQSKHTEPVCDVFSAGAIFHLLLTGKPLFEGTKYDEVYKKNKEMNLKLQGENYNTVDGAALDLLKKMLVSNPKKRITAEAALDHPFLKSELVEELNQKQNSPCLTASSNKHSKRLLYY